MIMERRLLKRAGLMTALAVIAVPVLAACGAEPTPTTVAPTATTAVAEATATTAEAAPTATTAEATATTAEPEETPTEAMAGTTPTSGGGTGAKIKVGLVTDVGKVNDGTFNQFAYEGLKRAEQELGVETAFIETQAQADYEKNMDQFANQGFDMIIGVGFLMGDAVKANATKHPDIKYTIVDFAYDPVVPNVRGLVFSEDEAGYLAGALAASMSKSNVIGVVGGVEIPPVQKYVMGYENGAKSIKADIDVKKVYIDSFTDRARGAEAAKDFISQGADVIFGAGGQTGSGGIQAAAQQGVWVIGVDQDEYLTTFQNGATPGSDKLLSSAMKRVDNAVFGAIKDASEGKLEGGTSVNTAASEGVGLAPFHDADASIPADVKSKLDEILKGLADGSVKTNVTLP
jgi:basic membrane protein A and related proteins